MRTPSEPCDAVAPHMGQRNLFCLSLLPAFKVGVHSQLDNDTSYITHQISGNNGHFTDSPPYLWFTDNKDGIITVVTTVSSGEDRNNVGYVYRSDLINCTNQTICSIQD